MSQHPVLSFFTEEDQIDLISILESLSLSKEEKLQLIAIKCSDAPQIYYEFEDILNQSEERSIPSSIRKLNSENSGVEAIPNSLPIDKPPKPAPRRTTGRTNESNLYDKIYSKLPDNVNLLLLGATGTGKTTLINALVNYINYTTLDRAVKEGVRVLVKTHFTETRQTSNGQFNTIPVILDPNIYTEIDQESKNEELEIGKSSTKYPRTYTFAFGPPDRQKFIRIIDSPGIMDTGGIEVDKDNFSRIMGTISKYDEIHAICILIRSHKSSLTLDFRFCMNELLSHLNKNATRNIVFCYTNCTGASFHPGESVETLKKHLNNLSKEHGIKIQLNEFTQFYFENDCYRYLCGLSQGLEYSDQDVRSYRMSWDKSAESVQRLLSRVAQLEPLDTAGILCVSNVRTAILALSRPFAVFTRLLIQNQELIDKHTKELKKNISAGKVRREGLVHYEAVPVIKELRDPALVCTSKKCTGVLKLNNGITYTDYKTVCHSKCRLDGVELEKFPNPAIQQCGMFKQFSGICLGCNCSWEVHMHLRYIIAIEMEKVLDVEEIDQNSLKAATEMINKLEVKKKYYTEEMYEIQRMCAYFAAFLKTNSLLKYNDSYQQYLNLLIREERARLAGGESDEHLKALEQNKQDYLHMITNIEVADFGELTIDRINELLTQLKTRKFHGDILEEIQKIHVKAEKEYDEQIVDLSLLPPSNTPNNSICRPEIVTEVLLQSREPQPTKSTIFQGTAKPYRF